MAAIQLSAPQKGDTLAVMHTNMGDIKIKLFPEKAPKTVENFVTHSKNGYYNGLKFHRVINDFIRAAIRAATARAANLFGAAAFPMNLIPSSTICAVRFPWQTQAPIQTAASSLSFRQGRFPQICLSKCATLRITAFLPI